MNYILICPVHILNVIAKLSTYATIHSPNKLQQLHVDAFLYSFSSPKNFTLYSVEVFSSPLTSCVSMTYTHDLQLLLSHVKDHPTTQLIVRNTLHPFYYLS